MAVPREIWPAYECQEMGGTAWHATVVTATGHTAVVRFLHAKTATGRDYQDVRLPLAALRWIA